MSRGRGLSVRGRGYLSGGGVTCEGEWFTCQGEGLYTTREGLCIKGRGDGRRGLFNVHVIQFTSLFDVIFKPMVTERSLSSSDWTVAGQRSSAEWAVLRMWPSTRLCSHRTYLGSTPGADQLASDLRFRPGLTVTSSISVWNKFNESQQTMSQDRS